jgi:hypothetical protein
MLLLAMGLEDDDVTLARGLMGTGLAGTASTRIPSSFKFSFGSPRYREPFSAEENSLPIGYPFAYDDRELPAHELSHFEASRSMRFESA